MGIFSPGGDDFFVMGFLDILPALPQGRQGWATGKKTNTTQHKHKHSALSSWARGRLAMRRRARPPGRQQAASQAAKAARARLGRQRPPGPPVRPPAGRQGRQGRQARPPGHPGRQRPPEAARAARRAARGSVGLVNLASGPLANPGGLGTEAFEAFSSGSQILPAGMQCLRGLLLCERKILPAAMQCLHQ